MPRRTIIFNQYPWNGGLNTAVDSGFIPSNDLVQADNIVFTSSGARLKRDNFSYFDTNIPTVISRSSSGTTRTLVFSSSISIAAPEDRILIVGESITVTSSSGLANYTGNFTITGISTTTITNDTITYTAGSSLAEGATATTALSVTRNYSIIGHHDYWRTDPSNVKVRLLIAITSLGWFFKYDDNGRRVRLTDAGTAYVTNPTTAMFAVMNNRLIIAVDGIGNIPKKYRPEDSANVQNLGGTPPDFSLVQQHQGRIWTNDKIRKDRLHYSATANPEAWQGVDDSGALDLGVNDGDPEGITLITPTFKDNIFATKRTKTYQVAGNSQENYAIIPVTNGIGSNAGQSAVAVDFDDVLYASEKGIHSLQTTNNYGDFTGAFVSNKIQPTYRDFIQGRYKYIKSVYVSDINSVAFAVSELSNTTNDNLYLYNVNIKEWYRWPNINAQSLAIRKVEDSFKLTAGTNKGRIIIAQQGDFTDFGTQAITYRIKTGTIYVDQNPMTMKGFKKLTLLYRPKGNYQFTAKIKIDGYEQQTVSFGDFAATDVLGTDFILGSSILGGVGIPAPFSHQIDGYGRGIVIEIEQTGTDQQVEIYGLMIEYEPADINQETVQ